MKLYTYNPIKETEEKIRNNTKNTSRKEEKIKNKKKEKKPKGKTGRDRCRNSNALIIIINMY
jgi:hypothetical protein